MVGSRARRVARAKSRRVGDPCATACASPSPPLPSPRVHWSVRTKGPMTGATTSHVGILTCATLSRRLRVVARRVMGRRPKAAELCRRTFWFLAGSLTPTSAPKIVGLNSPRRAAALASRLPTKIRDFLGAPLASTLPTAWEEF